MGILRNKKQGIERAAALFKAPPSWDYCSLCDRQRIVVTVHTFTVTDIALLEHNSRKKLDAFPKHSYNKTKAS
jgi:hypothetical protein